MNTPAFRRTPRAGPPGWSTQTKVRNTARQPPIRDPKRCPRRPPHPRPRASASTTQASWNVAAPRRTFAPWRLLLVRRLPRRLLDGKPFCSTARHPSRWFGRPRPLPAPPIMLASARSPPTAQAPWPPRDSMLRRPQTPTSFHAQRQSSRQPTVLARTAGRFSTHRSTARAFVHRWMLPKSSVTQGCQLAPSSSCQVSCTCWAASPEADSPTAAASH